MNKRVCIRQQDVTDCGAACLASVSAFYHLRIAVARIRQMASTDGNGTNIMGMIEAAEKLGFDAKGVKGPYESLFRIPRPSILHVIVNERLHHFVVLYGINKSRLLLMDPSDGRIHRKTHHEFRKEWTGIIILVSPADGFKPGKPEGIIAARFIRLLQPHKGVMFLCFLGAAVSSLLGISTSLYLKSVIDLVLTRGNLDLMLMMSLAMFFILVTKTCLNIAKSMFILRTGQHIDAVLVMGYYKHLLRLPKRFFDTMKTGEIISRVNDAVKIRAFLSHVSLELTTNLLIVLTTLVVMLVFSWKLTLVVLTGILIYTGLYLTYNYFNRHFSRRIMEDAAMLESHFIESLGHISTIKHFGAEDQACMKSETGFVRLLKSSFGSQKQSILTLNASDFIAGSLVIGIIWTGTSMVLSQEISSGMLVSFYTLLGYLTLPVNSLIKANHSIQEALIAADRLFQIMDLAQEEDRHHKFDLARIEVGDMLFQQVSFRYGTRVQVFKDLNMKISQGMTTAIVGESGSGKTSLVSLMHNLYPIQSGSIKIGRYNIQQISNASLREMIGVVPQKIELFNGSIMENIAFGSPDCDMKKMIYTCDLLHIRSFIESLPQGFQTHVGEKGVALSGGERQRIAIARAMYHDPEILVLDEATSSLDSESERDVKAALVSLKQKRKTIVIISHRLSTVMDADKICVLKKGRLVEEGQHADLIRKESHYYRMWQQTGLNNG